MTPKFIKTTIPEKEALGEKLAKKRVALGYDIKEVERATRIRAKYLEMIEAGNYEKLPPDVYVRGFLKNYASFLRLDVNKVTRLYLKERGLKENVKKAIAPKEPTKTPVRKKKGPKVIITPKRLFIASALAGAFIIVAYIGWQISILAAPPKIEIRSPQDNVKIEDDSTIIEGKTDAGADVFINSVQIGVDPDGNFKEKISLQEGINLIKVSAKNKLGKTSQISRTVLAKLKPIAETASTSKGLEMKLDIGPNSSALYIEVDGKAISDKNAVMLPGSSQLLAANEKIVITASDGGSVRVKLNGKDLGTLGKAGEKIKAREFNKSSI